MKGNGNASMSVHSIHRAAHKRPTTSSSAASDMTAMKIVPSPTITWKL